MVLPVIAFLAIGINSCGKNKATVPAADMVIVKVDSVKPNSNMVFVEVDSMPVFGGGDKEILNYIATNTTYPKEAKEKNIAGKVIVRFIVEKDCSVTSTEILHGVDPLLDAEALRVVSTLPKFEKPAIKDGKIVRVYYMVPITFALQ